MATSTQIIYTLQMLKFSKIMFFKEQICVRENEKYFGILKTKIEMESSKLIDYSIDMCWSCLYRMVDHGIKYSIRFIFIFYWALLVT